MASSIPVGPDTFVTLSYVLFDQKDEAVDRTAEDNPLTYIHGYAQIVPGLEKGLAGLKAGERRSIVVEADEAFGQRDDDGIFQVEKDDFPDNDDVSAGDEFLAQGPDGEPITMRILEVRKDAFVVDTNHPLAGQRVRFEIEVNDVRQASDEEIAEAQQELEEAAGHDGCCGHDHDHDHDHAHDHDHDGGGERLVQLAKKA